MEGGVNPSPFAALSFPDSKKVPNYCWVNSVFHSSDSADTRARSHDLLTTLCAITGPRSAISGAPDS